MTRYQNTLGQESGVTAFEIGEDFIIIQFTHSIYLYNYDSAGPEMIEKMKSLALEGKGLSTFISRHKPSYLERIR